MKTSQKEFCGSKSIIISTQVCYRSMSTYCPFSVIYLSINVYLCPLVSFTVLASRAYLSAFHLTLSHLTTSQSIFRIVSFINAHMVLYLVTTSPLVMQLLSWDSAVPAVLLWWNFVMLFIVLCAYVRVLTLMTGFSKQH